MNGATRTAQTALEIATVDRARALPSKQFGTPLDDDAQQELRVIIREAGSLQAAAGQLGLPRPTVAAAAAGGNLRDGSKALLTDAMRKHRER